MASNNPNNNNLTSIKPDRQPNKLNILRNTLKQRRTNYKKSKKQHKNRYYKHLQNKIQQTTTITKSNRKPEQQGIDRFTNQTSQQGSKVHLYTYIRHNTHRNQTSFRIQEENAPTVLFPVPTKYHLSNF